MKGNASQNIKLNDTNKLEDNEKKQAEMHVIIPENYATQDKLNASEI